MTNAQLEEIQAGGCRVAVARQDHYQDKTLVFLHGNSLSLQIWEKQFAGTLHQQFNLLAFDLPGHGNSSRASHPEQVYTLQGYRQVLLDIIGHYQLQQFVLVGHSLGGHVVLESLPYVQGCLAAVVMGTPPLRKPLDMQDVYLPHPSAGFLFAPEAPPEALQQLTLALMGESNPRPPAFLEENYKKTDPQARVSIGQCAAQGMYDDEVEILTKTSVPVTIVHGDEDQLVNLDYLLKLPLQSGKHQVMTIPQAGHMVPYENPVHFNHLLMSLLLPQEAS